MQVWTNSNANGEANRHEYDIKTDGNRLSMRYSNAGHWAHPTSLCATLIDDGEVVEINLSGMETIRLSYADAEKVLVLLALNNDSKIKITEQKVVKEL